MDFIRSFLLFKFYSNCMLNNWTASRTQCNARLAKYLSSSAVLGLNEYLNVKWNTLLMLILFIRQTPWHNAQGRDTGTGNLHFDNQKKKGDDWICSVFFCYYLLCFFGRFFFLGCRACQTVCTTNGVNNNNIRLFAERNSWMWAGVVGRLTTPLSSILN